MLFLALFEPIYEAWEAAQPLAKRSPPRSCPEHRRLLLPEFAEEILNILQSPTRISRLSPEITRNVADSSLTHLWSNQEANRVVVYLLPRHRLLRLLLLLLLLAREQFFLLLSHYANFSGSKCVSRWWTAVCCRSH